MEEILPPFIWAAEPPLDGEKPWHNPKDEPSVWAQDPPAKRLPAPGDLSGVWEADVSTLSLSCSTLHEIIQHELDH